MSTIITIDTYTANWQTAMRPVSPRIGTRIRMSTEPDAREADDFNRCIRSNDIAMEWVRYMPRLKMDEYVLVVRQQNEE